MTGFEDGGEAKSKAKTVVASRSWKSQGSGFSPRASRKEDSPDDILIF